MKTFIKHLFATGLLAATGMTVSMASCALAEEVPVPLVDDHHLMAMTTDDTAPAKAGKHAGHEHKMGHMTGMMPVTTEVTKTSTVQYTLPEVKLTRAVDGKSVYLAQELNDGRAVILDFIYTSCTEICPVTSRIFSQLQSKLGKDRDKVHLVSISIDPEQDTPVVLREYARKFGAGPEWQHYTGAMEASIATQRAFDAYQGDKMNHTPVTFLRAAHGKSWVRIDGFVSADELLHKYQELVVSR